MLNRRIRRQAPVLNRSTAVLGIPTALALLGCIACSSSDAGPTTQSSTQTNAQAGSGNANGVDGTDVVTPRTVEQVGQFGVQLVAPVLDAGGETITQGFTSVLGKVYDAPVPERVVWEEASTEGGCTLLTPRVPFCDPGCGTGVCIEDDTCVDSPPTHDLGTVTFTGLEHDGDIASFEIEPVSNNYITPAAIDLPFPAFDEGAPIELRTSGGDLAPFSISGKGILPLEMNGTAPYPFGSDSDFEISWSPAGASDVSKIHVKIDISHHGGSKGMIECDGDDNGSLVIAKSMVADLIALGVAGFPTVVLTRQNVTSVFTEPGRVDLNIYQYVERELAIGGLVSCTDTQDCPAGQTCRDDLTCG